MKKRTKPRYNNHYLIIIDGDKNYSFQSEGGYEYSLIEERPIQIGVEAIPIKEYKIKDIIIYMIIEPQSDGEWNKINNQIKLLRNLPKHYRKISKYDIEKYIKEVKNG